MQSSISSFYFITFFVDVQHLKLLESLIFMKFEIIVHLVWSVENLNVFWILEVWIFLKYLKPIEESYN